MRNDSVVQFGYFVAEPYAYDCFNNTDCSYPSGFGIDLARLVCDFMSAHCDFVFVGHQMYGDNITGSWRGIIGDILNGTFDAGLPIFTPVKNMKAVVDFSDAFVYVNEVLVTRKPEGQQLSLFSLMAFPADFWFFLMLGGLGLSICLLITQLAFNSQIRSPLGLARTAFDTTIDLLSVLSGHGARLASSSEVYHESIRIAIAIWAVVAVVIGGIYSGSLLATLIDQSKKPPFSDLATLAVCLKERQCELITGSISTSRIAGLFDDSEELNAEQIALREGIEASPIRIVPENASFYYVQNHKSRFAVMWIPYSQLATFPADLELCDFAIFRVQFSVWSIPVRKPHNNTEPDLLSRINVAQKNIQTSGLLDGLMKKYRLEDLAANCKAESRIASGLSLLSTAGAFFFLCIGYFLGILLFSFELLSRLLRRSRNGVGQRILIQGGHPSFSYNPSSPRHNAYRSIFADRN